jgi:hypothetical protein
MDTRLLGVYILSFTVAIAISGRLIYKHLTNFHEPRFQLYIVRIILIVPIYAIHSLLSLLFPKQALVFDTIKDCYDGYVLYIFLQLLIQYLGGENTMIAYIEIQGKVKHPWPFTHSLRPIQTTRSFYRKIRQGTLQFVLLKPFLAVVALLLYTQNLYDDGALSYDSGYLYCSLITNVSISVALYCLALFYKATEERLYVYKPFWKFFVVKGIIFFSFWQSFGISLLVKLGVITDRNTALFYQDFLILLESAVAAIAQSYAFSYEEFINGNKISKPILTNLSQILSMKDVISDAKSAFVDEEEEYEKPLKEMVTNEFDKEAFSPGYKRPQSIKHRERLHSNLL